MTRISFDISPELHQRFKLYCAERKTTITDEVTKFINKTLEGAESESRPQPEPQKTVVINGETVIDDLDSDGFNAPANPTPKRDSSGLSDSVKSAL